MASWWRRLFGRPEVDPRARPEERDGELRDGEKHGVWVEQDGSRRVEVEYVDGVRHGRYRRWRGNGELLEEGAYAAGERDGPFVIYRAGGAVRMRGAYRAGAYEGAIATLAEDGTVEAEQVYRDGVLQDGVVERFHEVRRDWLRERGTMRGGERDGTWEEYFVDGKVLARTEYRGGRKDGPYLRNHHDGHRHVEGAYADDRPVGRWSYGRYDGTLAAEVDHDEGWLRLGDAWDEAIGDRGGSYGIQLAVDAWPDDDRARPLDWIAARTAEGARPRRWDAGSEWLYAMLERDDDPRAALIEAIAIDHHDWSADHVAHLLRRAPQLVELALDECHVEPAIEALFPPGAAWTRLEVLWLHDCGPLAEAARRIAAEAGAWPALRELYLGGHDDRSSADDLAPILAAPWLDRLTWLGLAVEGDPSAVVGALAARALPALRTLELRFDADDHVEAARTALRAAYPDATIDVGT